jgi:hypothetical protein
MSLELVFVEHKIEIYIETLARFLAKGSNKIVVRGQDGIIEQFVAKAKELAPDAELFCGGESDLKGTTHDTIVFLLETSPSSLSSMLMDYANATVGAVCAPLTEHYMSRRPALVNGIPKAGTHVLFELMRAFGYQEPRSDALPSYHDSFNPGAYYNLQHITRRYLAQPMQNIGSFIDVICSSPILLIVRDPKDVVVSLAHYLSVETAYHILQSHFANLSAKERILAVIRGDYPVPIYINRDMYFNGNIRDLYLAYADWLRFPLTNTIILRFEDLIGPRGGGNLERQLRSIWTAQLALHVSGTPEQFAEHVFAPTSVTFRKGRIGSHKQEFQKDHWTAFNSLQADFLKLFGYEQTELRDFTSYPFWRCFQGEIKTQVTRAEPQLMEESYQHFNFVAYDHKVWAVDQRVGPTDLRDASARERLAAEGRLVAATTLGGARLAVDRQVLEERTVALSSVFNDRLQTLGRDLEHKLGAVLRAQESVCREELTRLDEALATLTDKVKTLTDDGNRKRLDMVEGNCAEPQLMEESYQHFNFVAYDHKVWAVDQRVGPTDLRDASARERLAAEGRLVAATTLDGARLAVDIRLLEESVRAIETRLDEFNALISEVKLSKQLAQDTDRELDRLRSRVSEFESTLVRICEECRQSVSQAKSNLEEQIGDLRQNTLVRVGSYITKKNKKVRETPS